MTNVSTASLTLVVVLCLSMCALGQRCGNGGASEMYAQALQSNIELVQWRCVGCNCCDTEDMLAASSERGSLCETISAFWFDPSQVQEGSRYRCDANKRAALDENGFNVTRCSDPSYDFYSHACCCVGCSEAVEIVDDLKDKVKGTPPAPAAGLGTAPAGRADVCQCGPEILPLPEQGRRLLATDPDAVYQERHVGECVGGCSAATPTSSGSGKADQAEQADQAETSAANHAVSAAWICLLFAAFSFL